MGTTGRFRIEYRVELLKLRNALKRAENMINAHAQRVKGGSAIPPTALGFSEQQTRSLNSWSRAMNAAIRHQQTMNSALSEQRVEARGAAREMHYFGLALRRMLLWWSTAALLLGTQR